MKYSLRSLMIIVTLAGILLGIGVRMRDAHQRAKYHWKQANFFGDLLFRTPHEERGKHTEWDSGFRRHCRLAEAYEQAVHRPWVIVDESSR